MLDYFEALTKIYLNNETKTFLYSNPLIVYNILCDLVGNSDIDKALAKDYYELNKRINVLNKIDEDGIKDTLNFFIPYYMVVKDQMTRTDYKMIIRSCVELYDPNYFKTELKEEQKKYVVIEKASKTHINKPNITKPKTHKTTTIVKQKLDSNQLYKFDVASADTLIINSAVADINFTKTFNNHSFQLRNRNKSIPTNIQYECSYNEKKREYTINIPKRNNKIDDLVLMINPNNNAFKKIVINLKGYCYVMIDKEDEKSEYDIKTENGMLFFSGIANSIHLTTLSGNIDFTGKARLIEMSFPTMRYHEAKKRFLSKINFLKYRKHVYDFSSGCEILYIKR